MQPPLAHRPVQAFSSDIGAARLPASDDEAFGSFAPSPAQRLLLALTRRSWLKRGAFRPWVSRVLSSLRPGPVDTTYQGACFRFHHRGSATECGALLNVDYNREEIDFLRAHVRPGDTVVDLGANVGLFALVMARHVGATGRVVAVEPHPVSRGRLLFNAAASGVTHLSVAAVAVGASQGTQAMATDANNLAASRMVPTADQGCLQVPTLPLLQILRDAAVERVDAIKIDVEGFEDRALIGFFRDAPAPLWPRTVVIEHLSCAEWEQDCLADMVARGYAIAARTRSNTMLIRSGSAATGARTQAGSCEMAR